MPLLFGHDDVVAHWAGEKLECRFTPPFTTIARISPEGRLIAASVFSVFSGPNVELSMYAPGRAFQREFWSATLRYPFDQLGVLRITMHTRRSNKWTNDQLRKFSTFEGVQRKFFGPTRKDDAFVWGIFPNHPMVRLYGYGERLQRTKTARSSENGGSTGEGEQRNGDCSDGSERPEPEHADGEPVVQTNWHVA